MQHGRMIAATEVGADLLERQTGQTSCQVHAHLARPQNLAVAPMRLQLSRRHAKVATHTLGNALDRWPACLDLVSELLRDTRKLQRAGLTADQHFQTVDGAFEHPCAADEVLRQPGKRLRRYRKLPALHQ